MEIRQLTSVLESLICLAMLILLFLSLLPEVRLDGFRQDMFSIRDELFDYAASGRISFNDPAYRLLRQLMNGFIRYGHQLTFFRTCVTVFQFKVMHESNEMTWTTKWEHSLENIKDQDVRNALTAFHDRAAALVAVRLVLGSPVLIIFLLCAVLTMAIQKGLHSLRQMFSDAASTTVSQIMDPRLLEEEAVKAEAA